MKAHILENDIVTNTIMVETLPDGALDASLYPGGIGWAWDGGKLIAPPPEPAPDPVIPTSMTIRKCCLQLEIDGVLDDVEAAVSTMPKLAQIEWLRATDVERANPLVPAMQQILVWDTERVDQFFIEANRL